MLLKDPENIIYLLVILIAGNYLHFIRKTTTLKDAAEIDNITMFTFTLVVQSF